MTGLGPESTAFKFEHLLFEGYTAGGIEAADFAIAANYTVAGDD